jgi:hypothetical protein
MLFRALADLVVLIHLAFIVFVISGGLLAVKWSWIPWLHLPALFWGILLELRGWVCPLTPLENWLRQTSGGAGYPEGFVEHYVLPVVYPADLTAKTQVFLALLACAINVVVYLFVWRVRIRRHSPGLS